VRLDSSFGRCSRRPKLPRPLLLLALVYTVASLAHFVHNAEYIAFYPNLPGWITRESVYQAWLAVAAVGAGGLLLFTLGFPAAGSLVLGAYGALGLDGLLHYTLASCAEHTLAANVTIMAEASAGGVLAVSAVWLAASHLRTRWRAMATR
jgi:hypothetical protein